jgi:hypothetical protein
MNSRPRLIAARFWCFKTGKLRLGRRCPHFVAMIVAKFTIGSADRMAARRIDRLSSVRQE